MKEKIDIIGKAIIAEYIAKRYLIIGDIHLGAGYRDDYSGAIISTERYNRLIKDIDDTISKCGGLDAIVILGDIKNDFSGINEGERYEIVNFFDHIGEKVDEVIVIKGNHDNFIEKNVVNRGIEVRKSFIIGETCLIHGDKEINEMKQKGIKRVIMAHIHPAINLSEGSKSEKFKCFLEGRHEGKDWIIMPSFAEGGGLDVKEIERDDVFGLKLKNFRVIIVGEEFENYMFGKLSEINH